jgi:hypothetical protein
LHEEIEEEREVRHRMEEEKMIIINELSSLEENLEEKNEII